MKLNRDNRIKYISTKIDVVTTIMLQTIELLFQDENHKKRVEKELEKILKDDAEFQEACKFIEDFQKAEEESRLDNRRSPQTRNNGNEKRPGKPI